MMNQKIIVVRSINMPPETEEIDNELSKLGPGWKVASARTSVTVFGIEENSGCPPMHHAIYTTTIITEKE